MCHFGIAFIHYNILQRNKMYNCINIKFFPCVGMTFGYVQQNAVMNPATKTNKQKTGKGPQPRQQAKGWKHNST